MATFKPNIFTKLLIMLLMLISPIVILYGYSYSTSINVIKSQIQQLNLNRLTFFQSQIEDESQHLMLLASVISRDYSIQSLQVGNDFSSYVEISSLNAVEQKLRLQQIAGKWNSKIMVYYPQVGRIVPDSLASANPLDFASLPEWNKGGWVLEREPGSSGALRFAHYVVDPYLADARTVQQITKIYFPADMLRNLLTDFNRDKQGETLLYHEKFGILTPSTAGSNFNTQISAYVENNLSPTAPHRIVRLGGERYVLNTLKLDSLDCYIVDLVPMDSILIPITNSRILFNGSIAVLIIVGIAASLLLYRYIQIPMKQLLLGVRKVRHGDYSIRIPERKDSDFGYLFAGFNYMAADIQVLIEQVYAEQLHAKEAKLKQLQAQINPHFLYNCLFYIMNTATLGDEESVIAMSLNLGEYFRYTTRNDKETATVQEEIQLVTNYLNIQQLRMNRLSFNIEMQADLLNQPLPRLSIQPIVENAVIHGIEPLPERGHIRIRGTRQGDWNFIRIEDNGLGMQPEAMKQLASSLERDHEEHRGYGVWNTHQRLSLLYGPCSGLELQQLPDGGMQFTLKWQTPISQLKAGFTDDATAVS